MDNDDLWTEDKLERQLALANSGADIVYCSYDFIDEQNNSIKKPFVVPQQTNFNKMLTSSVISCSTSFIKTELMQAHLSTRTFIMRIMSCRWNCSGVAQLHTVIQKC